MNVVKIWGGLGNQMFQYAFGRASARATGQEVRFDLSWFSGKADRKYELGAYRCTVDEIDGRLVRRLTRGKPLLRLFGLGHPKFFVFSDDLAWCRTSLKLLGEVTFVRLPYPDRPELDMYLMSRCRHNIIANSTFSWWGAYLNDHPEKLVVAPKSWYVSMKNDILPESWIKL